MGEYQYLPNPGNGEKSQSISNSFTSPPSPLLTHTDYPQKRLSEDIDPSQVLTMSIPSHGQTNSSPSLPSVPTHQCEIKIQKGNHSVISSFHPYSHQHQQQKKKRQNHHKHHHSNVFSKDALEDEEKRYAMLIRRLDGFSLTVDVIRQQFCMFKTYEFERMIIIIIIIIIISNSRDEFNSHPKCTVCSNKL